MVISDLSFPGDASFGKELEVFGEGGLDHGAVNFREVDNLDTGFKMPPEIDISTRRNGRRSAQKGRAGTHGQVVHPAMARTAVGVWPSARRLRSVWALSRLANRLPWASVSSL